MISAKILLHAGLCGAGLLCGLPAHAAEQFPFGLEMTLDVAPQPGSKRMPTLEIGDAGDTRLGLWCKDGKGQFSVAGNTIVFVAGAMDARTCTAARAQLDDELLATLTEATNWKRQADVITFVGAKSLRFRLNTN